MIISRKSNVKPITNRKPVLDAGTEATIYLYEDIGGYWGISPNDWIKEFAEITANTVHIRINSDGGDVFAARAMKTAIMQHSSKTIAHIDGLAASAASFLAMGADEREIIEGGFFMVHKALSFIDIFGYYNESDLEVLMNELGAEKDLHEKINDSIASDYAKVTGKSKDVVLSWMEKETWFNAQESLDVGLVDRIYEGDPVSGSYDLSMFNNAPKELVDRTSTDIKRVAEKGMRNVGISAKVAKMILAEGYSSIANSREDSAIDNTNNQDQMNVIDSDQNQQREVVDNSKSPDRTHDLLIRAEMLAPNFEK